MRQEFEQEYLQLGLKIAYYRKLRGLTQEELAERIDRSAAFVGHVEAPNIKKGNLHGHALFHRAGAGYSGVSLPDF